MDVALHRAVDAHVLAFDPAFDEATGADMQQPVVRD